MKSSHIILLAAACILAGCDPTDNGGGTDNSGGGDGTTPEITLPDLDDPDDDVSATSFSRTVTVTFSPKDDAKVEGTSDDFSVTIYGYPVTSVNNGDEAVNYILNGESENGRFKLYSGKKQAIELNGVNLTNPNGAVINIQGPVATPNKGKRTFIVVKNDNYLKQGPSSGSPDTPDGEDEKGAIFSEGKLIFSDRGYLEVQADDMSGIVSDDYVRVIDNTRMLIKSDGGHGIRGKDWILISDGKIDVDVSADMKKGFSSDSIVRIDGGSISIEVSGGTGIDDEEQEYTGSAGIKADKQFVMTDGRLTIFNDGMGGKGIRAGSYDADNPTLPDSYITGGEIHIETTGESSPASMGDVSAKGIRIGYKETTGSGKTATTLCAGNLVITGGKIKVRSEHCEAIEVKGNLTIKGGEIYATSDSEDAINSQSDLVVDGGMIYAWSAGNDAMDANGDMKINGGYVFAVTTKGAPEVALDANTEEQHKLYINEGATVVAYGGLESGASLSQKCYTMSCTADSWNSLTGADGELCAFKAPSGVSSVVVSAPGLSAGKKGVTVSGDTYCEGTWALTGISGGSSVTLSTYSSGSGSNPGGSPGGGPGGGPGGH